MGFRSKRSCRSGVALFAAALLTSPVYADTPDISARRLLSSWRDGDPSMRLFLLRLRCRFRDFDAEGNDQPTESRSYGLAWRVLLIGKMRGALWSTDAHSACCLRPGTYHRPDLRTGGDDAFLHRRARRFGHAGDHHIRLNGAQHEVRHRPLRPLPVRPDLYLPGRAGVHVRAPPPDFRHAGALTWLHLSASRNSLSGNS